MASGDNFLKTLTIEGEYDRSNNFRKFNRPVVYVRVPSPTPRSRTYLPAVRSLRRENSAPPTMGRPKLTAAPFYMSTNTVNGKSHFADLDPEGHDKFSRRAIQLLSSMWLPACFFGINAVSYAIDPTAAALMMASSSFLLHHMGVAGRQLTALVIVAGCAALLLHGSDVVYIMAVHTLYYFAVSMQNSNADLSGRIKRTYTKRARS